MAKNIIITVNAQTNAVKVNTETVGVMGENLQGQFIVDFVGASFVVGSAWLEIDSGNEKGYIELTRTGNTYSAPIKSGFTKRGGRLTAQVRITQEEVDGETPVFKSDIFYLKTLESINALEEIPDEYSEWIDVADAKLAEVDRVIKEMKVDALPDVTAEDKGKTLEVTEQGKWIVGDTLNEVKTELSKVNGKVFNVKQNYWQAVSTTRYKYEITSEQHGLTNPYIDKVVMSGGQTILEEKVYLNGDIVIYSNLAIDCKITLKEG